MRMTVLFLAALGAATAFAKLPPPSEEDRAKAAEAAAKSAYEGKVGAYQTCLAIDRTAEAYRRSQAAVGRQVPAPIPTPPCVDPGPAPSAKPLEAAGAHSPPDAAHTPPSGVTPQSGKQ